MYAFELSFLSYNPVSIHDGVGLSITRILPPWYQYRLLYIAFNEGRITSPMSLPPAQQCNATDQHPTSKVNGACLCVPSMDVSRPLHLIRVVVLFQVRKDRGKEKKRGPLDISQPLNHRTSIDQLQRNQNRAPSNSYSMLLFSLT